MPTKVESAWKKSMTIIRDVVFILLFLASVFGWIRSETIKKTKLENQVEYLTKALEDNTEQLQCINKILMDQNTLNGKIILFMETNRQ